MRALFSIVAFVLAGLVPLAHADKLLVLSKAKSELAIIDPESLKVEKTVPVGHAPHEVCTSADTAISKNWSVTTK